MPYYQHVPLSGILQALSPTPLFGWSTYTRRTCESGSIAVGGRPAGADGFPPFVSLLGVVFRISLIGDFLPFEFDCALPEVAAIQVSVSATTKRRNHSI